MLDAQQANPYAESILKLDCLAAEASLYRHVMSTPNKTKKQKKTRTNQVGWELRADAQHVRQYVDS